MITHPATAATKANLILAALRRVDGRTAEQVRRHLSAQTLGRGLG